MIINNQLCFVDGVYAEGLSDAALLETLSLSTKDNVLQLTILKNYVSSKPIHLIFQGQSDIQLNIVSEENSEVVLCHAHENKNNLTIVLEKNAKLCYYKLKQSGNQELRVRQFQDSHFKAYFITTTSLQEDIHVELKSRGATCELYGLYMLNEHNHNVSHMIHIDHAASYTHSTMQFKGVLANKSNALFKGKVYVHQDAQHIEAHQENHNLLLTQDATVTTKPELEIYADDVKCTHGATVGQLDEEALFYLRSRGIEETQALQLLTQAFTADIFSRMSHVDMKDYAQKHMVYYATL